MTRSTRNRLLAGSLPGLLLAAGVGFVAARQEGISSLPHASPPAVLAFADIFDMTPEQVGQHDIAQLNLACSSGLKGAESLDGAASLALLDAWAREAGESTKQNLWRYHANPGLWKQSENWFRVSCMVRCLRVHAGTQYVPALRTHPPSRDMWDLKFYRDAHSIFLFGLLTGLRQGTCTSLPVLTVAVGRRLGYPLKLVKSAGHLFVRWDDGSGKEVFNIESTDEFAEIKSDDFYRSFPLPMNPADEASGRMMVSMTPVQELALFCFLRGHNLWQNGDLAGARQAYLKGHMLDPNSRQDEYAYRVYQVDRMAGEEAHIRKNMPWLPRGFCLNDPVNNIDPFGEENVVVSGTDGNRLFSKGVSDPETVTTYLDYAGIYYFGADQFESVGSFMTPLAFARKVFTLPIGFVSDVIRLRPDSLRNLTTPNFYTEDVAVNGGNVCDILTGSADSKDILMGHSQGVTLIAVGVAKASRGNPVQKNKVIKLILMAPKIQFELLESYLDEAKKNQPGWKIDTLIIGNRHDTSIPCGTKQGYLTARDPEYEAVRVPHGPALFTYRAQKRPGVHYDRGFPLSRHSTHWTTYEFADPDDPHDSRKHCGVRPTADLQVEAVGTPEATRVRETIKLFLEK